MVRRRTAAASTWGRPWPSLTWRPAQWLADVLVDAGLPDGDLVTLDPESVIVLRGGRRPLVAGDVVGAGGMPRTVVAKAYRDDRGAATLALLHRLVDSGLGVDPFQVTTGLAWSARHRTLITERATGEAWSEVMAGGGQRLEVTSRAVGQWLVALQSLPVRRLAEGWLPDRSDYRAERDLVSQVGLLGLVYPTYRRRLTGLAQQALSVLGAAPAVPVVPSHGDLHPHNVHVAVDPTGVVQVTALDLDTAGWRRPSYDPGYAVAQLLVMSRTRCQSFVPGARAALAFWSAWSPTERSATDRAAVPAQLTRALVQSLHYELVTLDNGRVDLLPSWCALAESALADGVPRLLDRLTRGWLS